MPLFQYYAWVGSFLLAALFAASWCICAPTARAPEVPLDQKVNIRIHTNHKWPERLVFDTSGSAFAQVAGAESRVGESEPPVVAGRQPFDAFAEMAAIPVRPCFRPPCSASQAAERQASRADKDAPFQIHSRIAARKDLIFPNRAHKLPGKS
jgi:hypothetical protein